MIHHRDYDDGASDSFDDTAHSSCIGWEHADYKIYENVKCMYAWMCLFFFSLSLSSALALFIVAAASFSSSLCPRLLFSLRHRSCWKRHALRTRERASTWTMGDESWIACQCFFYNINTSNNNANDI